MAQYADGFVIPVPKKRLEDYRKIARKAGKVWMDHGALSYYETVGDDLNPKMFTTFPKLAKLKRGETVVFSWIVYKSRKDRDRINAKVMQDPRMLKMMKDQEPFIDPKRMAFAGFNVIVRF